VNRRDFLMGAGAGCAGQAFGAAAARPNVVQILIDDMGFADLRCYGGEIETPHIDRLAVQGSRTGHLRGSRNRFRGARGFELAFRGHWSTPGSSQTGREARPRLVRGLPSSTPGRGTYIGRSF
jgi:hypothetical protein